MKKLILIISAALLASAASARQNPDIIYFGNDGSTIQRDELVIPDIDGYMVLKADLHIHTCYSDGRVTPAQRISEAWNDGLDILAITDHMDYRPNEVKWLKFLRGYVPEGTKAVNYNLVKKKATKEGIKVDLNLSVEEARKYADRMGILLIPGIEISKEPVNIGHFNALFTTDNNALYDPDPLECLRNVRKQGALLMHNHPGWSRTSVEMTEFEKKAYAENLFTGIEVVNGGEFYPKIIDRATEKNLFMSANTDLHLTTAEIYGSRGVRRNMTLVLAKERTLPSVREALEAARTIAYANNNLMGTEQLLKDLFNACVEIKCIETDKNGKRKYALTNRSGLVFDIKREGGAYPYHVVPLAPNRTLILSAGKNVNLEFTVANMWCGAEKHPSITIE